MTSIKLAFLGGAREVGASAVEVMSKEGSILLDFGVRLRKENPLPNIFNGHDLLASVISHAHLDHSGAIPLLAKDYPKTKIIATDLTLELSKILIDDMLNLFKRRYPFSFKDARKALKKATKIKYNTIKVINNFQIELLNAGHIPGSSSVYLNIDNKLRVWYSGDINTYRTNLLTPASKVVPESDIIITESTYALRNHPPREDVEREFVEALRESVERGGIALVPAFSVGRAQEVLNILTKYNFPYPIVLDGMARKVSEVLLRYPEYIRDIELFRNSINRAYWVDNGKERKNLLVEPKVIVSPAGMLQGGSAEYYMKHIYNDENSGIYLVGYQIPGTSGYRLLNDKKIRIGGRMKQVKAEVKSFELSSHIDRQELFNLLRKVDGSPIVFTIHGDQESCVQFANDIQTELGLKAIAPETGQIFKIEQK
ncbi:MAG: MBL fold metallo-hydrolase [Candidatus Asgardarchaeia archaeon]